MNRVEIKDTAGLRPEVIEVSGKGTLVVRGGGGGKWRDRFLYSQSTPSPQEYLLDEEFFKVFHMTKVRSTTTTTSTSSSSSSPTITTTTTTTMMMTIYAYVSSFLPSHPRSPFPSPPFMNNDATMEQEEFRRLPKWKGKKLKQEARLF